MMILKKQVVKEFTKQLYNLDTRSLLTEVTNILYCEKQKRKKLYKYKTTCINRVQITQVRILPFAFT